MKKLFLLFALAVFALPAIGQGIDFQQDMTAEQAIARAKAENKYVFVDVYTNWCGPCKMMDAQIYPLKEVGDYFNPKYVSIKLNAEVGEVGPAFAKQYGIKAYPTFVILDGNGELVHMFAGGVLSLAFIDRVEEAFDPGKAFGVLKRRYDAGDRDPRFVASYLEALQSSYTTDVTPMVEEFYKSTGDKDKICAECLFIFDGYARVWSEKDEFLTAHREEFRNVAGREKVDGVFKNKYTAYYANVIMGQDREATEESIDRTGDRLATLGLTDTAIFPLLQAAAITKVTGKGCDSVFGTVKQSVFALTDNEKNTLLYYVTIGLKDLLNQEQKDELVGLVTNESTKGYITRSITPR